MPLGNGFCCAGVKIECSLCNIIIIVGCQASLPWASIDAHIEQKH